MKGKALDYIQLIKPRLTFLVVFSAAMAYLWATRRQVDPTTIWLLSIGGFLITASSNVFNQVLELKTDGKMNRTAVRPLPDQRMSRKEASLAGLILGMGGLITLFQINTLSMLLGSLAMLTYVLVYTPMKKWSFLSIVPGAIAGSLPVVIGWTAATGNISQEAMILFFIQFIWQFPHTWSIAWLLNADYNRAGLKMLPTAERSGFSALLILFSAFLIVPSGLLLYLYGISGGVAATALVLAGAGIAWMAFRFYQARTDRSAVRFMLSCMIYLPLVLIILVAEKYL